MPMVAAFNFTERDRCEVVHEHPMSHFVVQNTGSRDHPDTQLRCLHITTRPRERGLVVLIITNADEDWSLGNDARNS